MPRHRVYREEATKHMRQRNFYTLVGIVVVALIAIVLDVSGINNAFTINLWKPVKINQGIDLQGGARVLLQAVPTNGQIPDDQTMEAARQIITDRVNGGLGVNEPVVQVVTNNNRRYISVELPGLKKDTQQVLNILQRTGVLTLVGNGSTNLAVGASTGSYPVLARGIDLNIKSVQVAADQFGRPAVDFSVNEPATTQISTYTSAHVGTGYMAVAVDGKVVSDPIIQGAITGGSGQITTNSTDEATSLATILRYGALPVPLKIQSVNEISASLGPSNVQASLLAGGVGLLIVIVFMAIYYRIPGILADVALIIYALVALAVFKVIPVTFTLAGIAGFILSIGMAVDANILIFERLKEELRAGHSIGAAVDAGFSRAWPSIRDSNISTMMTCVILWWFGSTFGASIIVGFATTLGLGVVISLLTAVLVSRTFLRLLVQGARPSNARLFGADALPRAQTPQAHVQPRGV